MKAIYLNYKIKSFLEDLGEDVSFIDIFFKTKEQEIIAFPISISYDKLKSFIGSVDKPAFDYLTKIRADIHGYGSKHSKIFAVIESEGFDLEKYIIQFITELDETDVDNHIAWCENLLSQKQQQKATEVFEKLSEIVTPQYVQHNLRFDAFKDEVDQMLHELTLKHFPELFEANEEVIDKYRNVLIRTTLSFTSECDKLLHGIV
jgi:hypothetical protein